MHTAKFMICLFLAFGPLTGQLFGQEINTPHHQNAPKTQSGPCGCACDVNCDCGCATGKPCECNHNKSNKNDNETNYSCELNLSEMAACEVAEETYSEYCESHETRNLGCRNCANLCEGNSCGIIGIAPPSISLNPQRCPFAESDCDFARRCGLWGVWLPECPVLFRTLLADPRQINYSVGWRFNDQALGKNIIDISFGDTLAIYRWNNIFHGELQLELEGALWGTFNPLSEDSPLINADYYVGFPITYAFGRWQFRLRGYHVSTHLGDEFILGQSYIDRRNPSAEFIDFFVSNDFTDEIRYYAGIGVIVHQDETFKTGRVFAEVGAELRLRHLGFTDFRNQLYGEPFYAMNFRFRKDFKHHIDQTYVLGYEVGKLYGLCRKVRAYLEYHDGYSLDGQFQKLATNYLSIRFSYSY